MKFRFGITFLLLLLFAVWNCSRREKGSPQTTDVKKSEGSAITLAEDHSPPRDSIIQSYFTAGYSIHIIAKVYGPDPILFPEYMWMKIYNSNGLTTISSDAIWNPDFTHGLFPLKPEWPDYFLVHENNLGNCCTCTADYLLKITADEIKVIGMVNDYREGKFYINICDWPAGKAHVEMTLTKHEVPLINDTLRYPKNWNI